MSWKIFLYLCLTHGINFFVTTELRTMGIKTVRLFPLSWTNVGRLAQLKSRWMSMLHPHTHTPSHTHTHTHTHAHTQPHPHAPCPFQRSMRKGKRGVPGKTYPVCDIRWNQLPYMAQQRAGQIKARDAESSSSLISRLQSSMNYFKPTLRGDLQ